MDHRSGSQGPERAPLDTRGTSNTPPSAQRRANRAEGDRLKKLQRSISVLHAARLCMLAGKAEPHVVVSVGASLIAHTSQHHRCGSPWACPICAPIVRMHRGVEVNEAVAEAERRGWSVLFPTFTVPHKRTDGLADRLAYIGEVGNKVRKGAPWDRRAERFGYVGSISSPEITWGEVNGWHPHAHQLWFFTGQMSDGQVEDLGSWAFERHRVLCERAGLGTPSSDAFKLVRVDSGSGLSDYLVKLEKPWTIGQEMTRSDRKNTKREKLTKLGPFHLLRWLLDTGEVQPLTLWNEYELATKGRPSVRFSKGLRADLLGVEVGASDEELAAVEATDPALLRVLVENVDWNRLVAAGRRAEFLDEFEDVAGFLLLTADLLGITLAPLDLEVTHAS